MNFLQFISREELCSNLASTLAAQLRSAIESKGYATLIVSGGSTPVQMFKELSRHPLNWEKVRLSLADERWVSSDHADSNTALIRKYLLKHKAKKAQFIPIWSNADTLQKGVKIANKTLDRYPETFDIVVLGMGSDGHTASLFPCAGKSELKNGLNPQPYVHCVAIQPGTAQHARISLTFPRLINTDRLILHITGQNKKAVLQKALANTNVEKMPVRAFLQQSDVPLDIYWAD